MLSLPIGLNRISWKLAAKRSVHSCGSAKAALPIGLNRISWKRCRDNGAALDDHGTPTDWVKSD